MDDEAAKFWAEFEAETGEKVEARCMGSWVDPENPAVPLWGLAVLTDACFRFRHLPGESWILSLFKPHGSSSTRKRVVDIAVPRASILALEESSHGLWARLFGPPFPRFTLVWTAPGEEAAARRDSFMVDPSTGLLPLLRALAPPPGASAAKSSP